MERYNFLTQGNALYLNVHHQEYKLKRSYFLAVQIHRTAASQIQVWSECNEMSNRIRRSTDGTHVTIE
jgi:hypothetical protein